MLILIINVFMRDFEDFPVLPENSVWNESFSEKLSSINSQAVSQTQCSNGLFGCFFNFLKMQKLLPKGLLKDM